MLVIVDRSPSMALFPAELPWLHKPDVVLEAGRMILASASAAHALVGYAEHGAPGRRWSAPRRDRGLARPDRAAAARHGRAGLGPHAVRRDAQARVWPSHSTSRRERSSSSSPTSCHPAEPAALRRLLATGWDVVPVVIQDPVWEQSFPGRRRCHAAACRYRRPGGDAGAAAALRGASAARGERAAGPAATRDVALARARLDRPVTSPDRRAIHGAFLAWAAGRHSPAPEGSVRRRPTADRSLARRSCGRSPRHG